MVNLSAWRRLLIALFSGVLLGLPFDAPGLATSWGAWVALAGLTLAAIGARPGLAFLCGFLSGAAFYTLTLPWVYTVMRVHGGVGVAPAAGVLALMVAVLSLFTAAFAAGMAWLGRGSVARACATAPFLWVALEYARTHMPIIGFPWDLLGYAGAQSLVLLQLASLTGIYGLSLFVAAYNALLAWTLIRARARQGCSALAVCLGVTLLFIATATLGGQLVPRESPRHTAHLVQTNFPQSPSYPADWTERHTLELDDLERLSIAAGQREPGLVIWPEVPAPFSLQDPKFAARAERIARASGSDFLVGVVEWRARTAASESGAAGGLTPYNSAAVLDPAGRLVFLYDKIHLVPFGEYVPLRRWLTFAEKLTAEVGDFQPGSEYKVGELRAGRGAEVPGGTGGRGTFAIFICYEAIFPAEVRRFLVKGAGLLVNLSNDGWFGHSAAPAQHLAMVRVRAAENRRWLLRATNNGYTAAVDPYGRYAARLAPDVRSVLDAPYGFRRDLTLYARWGDWLAWLCIGVSLYFVFSRARRTPAPAALREEQALRKKDQWG